MMVAGMTYTLTITRDKQTAPTIVVTDPRISVIVTAMYDELMRTKTAHTHVTVTGAAEATGPWDMRMLLNMEDPDIFEPDIDEQARALSAFLHWDADHHPRHT